MGWQPAQIGGKIDIVNDGKQVNVRYGNDALHSSLTFNGARVKRAYWRGDKVIVELDNGQKRAYSDSSSFGNA